MKKLTVLTIEEEGQGILGEVAEFILDMYRIIT